MAQVGGGGGGAAGNGPVVPATSLACMVLHCSRFTLMEVHHPYPLKNWPCITITPAHPPSTPMPLWGDGKLEPGAGTLSPSLGIPAGFIGLVQGWPLEPMLLWYWPDICGRSRRMPGWSWHCGFPPSWPSLSPGEGQHWGAWRRSSRSAGATL